MVNGGIKSRENVELNITCQRSYLNFGNFLRVTCTKLWMIITSSFIIEKMQTLSLRAQVQKVKAEEVIEFGIFWTLGEISKYVHKT